MMPAIDAKVYFAEAPCEMARAINRCNPNGFTPLAIRGDWAELAWDASEKLVYQQACMFTTTPAITRQFFATTRRLWVPAAWLREVCDD